MILPHSQLNSHFNVIPVSTERNNLPVAEPMKLSVGSFHQQYQMATQFKLLAQTLRIVKDFGMLGDITAADEI